MNSYIKIILTYVIVLVHAYDYSEDHISNPTPPEQNDTKSSMMKLHKMGHHHHTVTRHHMVEGHPIVE